MENTTSRRAVLTAALAAPALVAIGSTAAFAATPAPGMTEWNALVAALDRATAARTAAGLADDKAQAAYKAARSAIGDKPTPPTNATQYPRPIAEMTVGEIAQMVIDKTPPSPEYEAALAAWTTADDELGRQTNVDQTEPAWKQSVSDHSDATAALLAYPAPDHEALLYKVALIEAEWRGFDLCQDVQRHIFADVRRLAAQEG